MVTLGLAQAILAQQDQSEAVAGMGRRPVMLAVELFREQQDPGLRGFGRANVAGLEQQRRFALQDGKQDGIARITGLRKQALRAQDTHPCVNEPSGEPLDFGDRLPRRCRGDRTRCGSDDVDRGTDSRFGIRIAASRAKNRGESGERRNRGELRLAGLLEQAHRGAESSFGFGVASAEVVRRGSVVPGACLLE